MAITINDLKIKIKTDTAFNATYYVNSKIYYLHASRMENGLLPHEYYINIENYDSVDIFEYVYCYSIDEAIDYLIMVFNDRI